MLLQFGNMRIRKTNTSYIMVEGKNITDTVTAWIECSDCEYIVMAEYTGETDFYTVKVFKDKITEIPLAHIEMDSSGGSFFDDSLNTGDMFLDDFIMDILFGENGLIKEF